MLTKRKKKQMNDVKNTLKEKEGAWGRGERESLKKKGSKQERKKETDRQI